MFHWLSQGARKNTDKSLIGPSNCTDFVANNPDEFVNAYWEVGTFQVYTAS